MEYNYSYAAEIMSVDLEPDDESQLAEQYALAGVLAAHDAR